MKNRIIKLKYSIVVLLVFSFLNLNTSIAAPAVAEASADVIGSKSKGPYQPSYLLGPGDVLRISVWKEEGLQQEVLVRPDGAITFPLAGELEAGGKTALQLQQALVDSLKRFIPDPVVSVSVAQIVSNHIYVIGKVTRPTDFGAPSYINVMQALSMVGGLTPFAKPGEIKILRRVNGKEMAISFDYDDVAKGKKLEQNIILKNGDVIVVP